MTRKRLLATRLCDLGLDLAASRFAPLVEHVAEELGAAGIRLRPTFYLSTEYGCIVRSASIGLLWTDGFDFAQRLARAEGLRTRTPARILPTLRHEVGHAFCYVHRLYRTARFRRLFGVEGSFFGSYPDVWRPRAADQRRLERGEVIYLYATRHADEDFAICFQIWLAHAVGATRGDWRRSYRRRPVVLEKLAYVDEVVRRHGAEVPRFRPPAFDEPLERVTSTVGDWLRAVLAGSNYNLLPHSPVASPHRVQKA